MVSRYLLKLQYIGWWHHKNVKNGTRESGFSYKAGGHLGSDFGVKIGSRQWCNILREGVDTNIRTRFSRHIELGFDKIQLVFLSHSSKRLTCQFLVFLTCYACRDSETIPLIERNAEAKKQTNAGWDRYAKLGKYECNDATRWWAFSYTAPLIYLNKKGSYAQTRNRSPRKLKKKWRSASPRRFDFHRHEKFCSKATTWWYQ